MTHTIKWVIRLKYNTSLQEGYCKVLGQAERSQYSRQLYTAEETARAGRKRTWEGYTEPVLKEEEEEEEERVEEDPVGGDSKGTDNTAGNKVQPVDRKVDYRKVIINVYIMWKIYNSAIEYYYSHKVRIFEQL